MGKNAYPFRDQHIRIDLSGHIQIWNSDSMLVSVTCQNYLIILSQFFPLEIISLESGFFIKTI